MTTNNPDLYLNRTWVEDLMWGNNVTEFTVNTPTEVITWTRGNVYGAATMTWHRHTEEPTDDRTADFGTSHS